MPYQDLLPYRSGFGVDQDDPLQSDLDEPLRLIARLRGLGVAAVNVTCGSPYYNPHIQRPAMFPPSDGYPPPEDPLLAVARQIRATRCCQQAFPDLPMVGSGYSYLQEYLPHVAQATVRQGWTALVGLGRMVLSYPQLPADVLERGQLQRKQICRTFSDCTTAPRNGIVSGCFPLDPYYKQRPEADQLKRIKHGP
jgi:2,4-dienoyl-CoA reductase-like NADH-dependent reductase (Old Yellow Enzyme family)